MSAILMAIVSVAIAVNAQDVWDGTSTNTDWYSIGETEYHLYTAADLSGLANLVNQGVTFDGCDFYLEEDIDLNNKLWTPIGFGSWFRFGGYFNGNSHSIKNLYINVGECAIGLNPGVGLFGYAGVIENLQIQGKIVIKDRSFPGVCYIGGLAGSSSGIHNCICDIEMTDYVFFDQASTNIGLVAGSCGGTIEKVKCSGFFKCEYGDYGQLAKVRDNFGGIVGNCGTIKECSSNADITLNCYDGTQGAYYGGIAGRASQIENVIFSGTLHVTGYYNFNYYNVGGICGNVSQSCENAIFVPSEASFYSLASIQYFLGPIASKSSQGVVYTSYYDKEFALNDNGLGIGVSKEDLTSGIQLNSSFSSDIWEFTSGKLPQLKALKSKCGVYFTSDNGNVGMLFDEGESCTVSLKPASGWRISGLYANGEDCTYAISNNTYSIDNISSDIYLDIIYEQTGSSVKSMSKGKDCDIKISDGTLVLTTEEEGIPVNICDLNGILVYTAKSHSGIVSTKLEKGGYVVKVGDRSYKVMMH